MKTGFTMVQLSELEAIRIHVAAVDLIITVAALGDQDRQTLKTAIGIAKVRLDELIIRAGKEIPNA